MFTRAQRDQRIADAWPVDQFGAAGDGVTDDTVAIQRALDQLPARGGTVQLTKKQYAISSSLAFADQKYLIGNNSFGSRLIYSGTDFALRVGNATLGSGLSYGCGVMDLSILLTNNAGSAITLRETAGAVVERLYIEGVPNTNASRGVHIDGGNTSNVFSYIGNVICNHIYRGFVMTTTGTTVSTSATWVNCDALGDNILGSRGLWVDVGCGNMSRWFSGNLENCQRGVYMDGLSVHFYGPRFEIDNAYKEIEFTANAKGCCFFGGGAVRNVIDNSIGGTQQFFGVIKDLNTGAPYP